MLTRQRTILTLQPAFSRKQPAKHLSVRRHILSETEAAAAAAATSSTASTGSTLDELFDFPLQTAAEMERLEATVRRNASVWRQFVS